MAYLNQSNLNKLFANLEAKNLTFTRRPPAELTLTDLP